MELLCTFKSDLHHTEIWYDVEIPKLLYQFLAIQFQILMWWVSTGQKLVEFHN